MLWLAWAGFGLFLVWFVGRRLLPAALESPPMPRALPVAPPAWLFCEEGAALDRRARWFPLRPGGTTVVGARPRAATADTSFIYLTAEDVREDHLRVRYDAGTARYQVEPVDGAPVQHNNEPLPPGAPVPLADGDTLDLGHISRFRFTLTGPEEA